MEKAYPVRPIGYSYICDSCEEGEMLPTGKNNWAVDPILFEHECEECGTKNEFTLKYPYVKYLVTEEY